MSTPIQWQKGGGGKRGGQGVTGGQGRGGGNKSGSGPGGNCVCTKCGHTLPHEASKRCRDLVCPQCGSIMMRE